MDETGSRNVGRRLDAVRAQIYEAAKSAGRDPQTVVLVAVTKKIDVETIRAAIDSGQRDFGENYVQEGLAKVDAIDNPDVRWHLIGSLQSNKAARAARAFSLLHSVSSASVVRAISREMVACGRTANVLLQIRLGGGATRAGVDPDDALEAARAITAHSGLSLAGVMGVASMDGPARSQFARLASVLATLRRAELPRAPLTEMSAGMSADFRDAIAEGATIVRVGTAIFGRRQQ
jgi:pyridoxal phosphate enzyme (YggS family)